MLLAALPGLSAGWVACGYEAEHGGRVRARLLFDAFIGPSRQRILALGALFAAIAWLLLAGIDALDPAFREQWALAMSSQGSEDARAEALIAAQQGMLLRAVALVPVALLFWHAPVLIHREGTPVAKALFGSVLTVRHHFPAFVAYGLCWLAADVIVSVSLGLILGSMGVGQWAIAIAMPLSLVFCAAFYASLNATVEACMTLEEPPSARQDVATR